MVTVKLLKDVKINQQIIYCLIMNAVNWTLRRYPSYRLKQAIRQGKLTKLKFFGRWVASSKTSCRQYHLQRGWIWKPFGRFSVLMVSHVLTILTRFLPEKGQKNESASIRKKKFPTFYLDVNFCIHVDMNGISGITVVLKRMVEWIVAEDSNLNISLHWFIRS